MPPIIVRPFEEHDREAFFHVRAMTYNDGRAIPPDEQIFKTTRGFVAEIAGNIVGVFGILDFSCSRGAASLRDAAVAGVAVLPEYRRTGVGSAMMRWGLRHFRETGFQITSLYAFRESYYRKFGYEVCGKRVKLSVPVYRYPELLATLPVSRLSLDEAPRLSNCYETFCDRYSGMNRRTAAQWGRVLNDRATVYAAGDPVEAYAIIQHEWQFWQSQSISEFVWVTNRGYESLLATLAGIGINKTELEWHEPVSGPFVSNFLDQGVRVELERQVMYRLCDFKSTLEALRTSATGEFTLKVVDQLIPENEGPWRVTFSPDGVHVDKCESGAFQICEKHLIQAILGEPSFNDMSELGVVSSSSPKDLECATRLFAPQAVYRTDFY